MAVPGTAHPYPQLRGSASMGVIITTTSKLYIKLIYIELIYCLSSGIYGVRILTQDPNTDTPVIY